MQKNILLPVLLISAYSAEANVVSRSFAVKFKNAAEASSIRINTSVRAESGESIKVAAFSDLKGTVYTVSNTAVYEEDLKKFTNEFSILKKEANQNEATLVAKVSAPCVSRDDLGCRVAVESEALVVEVESAVSSLAEEEVNSVDLALATYKGLSNESLQTDKTLEDLQTSLSVKPAVETLVYSDTQSKTSLAVQADVDQYRNVGLSFKGKDGFVYLAAPSGLRAAFELEAPAPVAGLTFKRSLEVEAVAGNMMTAAVQLQSASVQAKIEQSVGDEYRGLMFDTSLRFDESSLKPDPAQSGYSVGNGILVLKEEQNLQNPIALETYWDLEPVEAADLLKNIVRTQVYKVKAGASERVIKFRSNSGQRAQLVLADTPDPSKKDISVLALDFVLGASQPAAGGADVDPFERAPAQPANPVDPFR